MNKFDQLRDFRSLSVLTVLASLVCLLTVISVTAAKAQGLGQIFQQAQNGASQAGSTLNSVLSGANPNTFASNANGTMANTNAGSSGQVRYNYFLRFPFAKLANQCDVLQTVSKAQAVNTGGKSQGNNNGRDSTTSAATAGSTTSSTGGSTGATSGQVNLQRSALNTTPTPQLAYDSVVVPCGQPTGHWLPGAQPWKQPQYASYTDMPAYIQPTPMIAQDKPLTMRDNELFQNQIKTWGLPVSDTLYQTIDRENKQRFLELMYDPERWMWMATNTSQLTGAAASNGLAGSSEAAYNNAFQGVMNGPASGGGGGGGGAAGGSAVGALINIANEQSGVPTASDNPNKSIPQAVWMVQQMYKQVFVPLAILFLLPGAVISQVKMTVLNGFGQSAVKPAQDEVMNPFEGVLRSVVAVFLIPATQLIVSYSIDVGNSMAYSVNDWVDLNLIFSWAHNLTYNTPPTNVDNAVNPPASTGGSSTVNGASNSGGGGGSSGGGLLSSLGSTFSFIPGAQSAMNGLQGALNSIGGFLGFGGGGEGLGADTPETSTISERQLWLSQIMEVAFNMATYLFSTCVIILGAYQLILMCYLMLLGPLAAAFYAWPSLGTQSSQQLFRSVFGNWCNAVIVTSLWRFYWMVILAIMTQRILYLMDSGGSNLNLQWEVAVFTCLLGLMLYVPFNPWNFDPAAAYQTASQAGSQLMSGSSPGQPGTGGLAGALGSAAIAGGANPGQVNSAIGQIGQINATQATQGQSAQQMLYSTEGLNPTTHEATGGSSSAGAMPTSSSSGISSPTSPATSMPPSSTTGGAGAGGTSETASSPAGAQFAAANAVEPPSSSSSAPPSESSSPSSSAPEAPAQLAAAFPGTSVSPAENLTPSVTAPESPSVQFNPASSGQEIASAVPSAQSVMSQFSGGGAPSSDGGGGLSGSNASSTDTGAGAISAAAIALNDTSNSSPPGTQGPPSSQEEEEA